jgi:hypothetical protein
MLGLALFFLSSSFAFLDELIDHKSRCKTTSSANHLERVCNHTPLIPFRLSLILYITGIRIAFFFFFIYLFIYPWLDAQLGVLGYASVDSAVLWQNECLLPH